PAAALRAVAGPRHRRGGRLHDGPAAGVGGRGGSVRRARAQAAMTAPLDPITLEVIHHGLMSFIKEMRYTIVRTSFGSNLRERHDFSCALQAPDGELIAIYQDNPPHIVPTVYAVKATLDRFGDDVHAGDIIMTNGPYSLGGHMNDTA